MFRYISFLLIGLSLLAGCKKSDDPSGVCQSPANLTASGITVSSATLNWSEVSGAVGYEYLLSLDTTLSGAGTLIYTNSYSAAGLSPNTVYTMRVRAKCGENDFSPWATLSFKTKDDYTTWIIKAGNNYAEGNTYPNFSGASISFKAIFDSSCIYATADPANQADICKLYGFADNGNFHQVNSARFGWNWLNDSLRIHAYCYVNSNRIYKEIATVPLNVPSDYSIEVIPGKYIFTLNGKKDTMDRFSTNPVAVGYKLFPYFGGDEPAPHDIRIRVKEVQ